MTLFEPEIGKLPEAAVSPSDAPAKIAGRVVRVTPDVLGLKKEFDYVWPDRLGDPVLGAVVRIRLNARNVGGWVTEVDPDTPREVSLQPIRKVTGIGPTAEIIGLCRWAAWRWCGRVPSLLRAASPERAVKMASTNRVRHLENHETYNHDPSYVATAALLERGVGTHVLTVSPDTAPETVAAAAMAQGQSIFIVPSVSLQDRVQRTLSRLGCSVAGWPKGFASAAGGHSIVGGRTAVFARASSLSSIVVWDEHDESLQCESSPTWHPREVAIERAKRLGIPCILVSPAPSLEAIGAATTAPIGLVSNRRRAGWAGTQIVDRRTDDSGRSGLFSEQFVAAVRAARSNGSRVICILNRTGRARLLACGSCGETAKCELCSAAVVMNDQKELSCLRCETTRPVVCSSCGSTHMKLLRLGVSKAAEDLESLLGEPVEAVTSGKGKHGSPAVSPNAAVLLGTEAVLHRVDQAGLVAFLDFDQELLAPRYRAAEEALALIILASRLVGGRGADAQRPKVLIQTRLPDHDVCRASAAGNPAIVAKSEHERRELLSMPPVSAIAAVGGTAAPDWVSRLGHPSGIEIQGPNDGWWLLRSESHTELCEAAAAVERPSGVLRLRVDPVRLR